METVTIMRMQKNINESKESHSFIGESLENSDIEHLFTSSSTISYPFTYMTMYTCS